MQATTTLRSGIRVQHLYDEMTRDKRPQDIGRNGSTLRFTLVEHLGFGCYQDSIHIADRIGRCATYIAKDAFIEEVQRPESDRLCGTDLRIETLGHGIDACDDDMPQALVVTDQHGLSTIYLPMTEDGKVVDSKSFEFGPASWTAGGPTS